MKQRPAGRASSSEKIIRDIKRQHRPLWAVFLFAGSVGDEKPRSGFTTNRKFDRYPQNAWNAARITKYRRTSVPRAMNALAISAKLSIKIASFRFEGRFVVRSAVFSIGVRVERCLTPKLT